MEYMNRRIFVILLACLTLCVACGANKIKGRPPFVSIAALAVQDQTLTARVDIYNINEVEMVIDSIELAIRTRDVDLAKRNGPLQLTVGPNTTENISVSQQAGENALQLLTGLENGEVASLPFSLLGRMHTRDDGYLPFEHEGHLYPVPGRQGQFRSTSSRSSRPR